MEDKVYKVKTLGKSLTLLNCFIERQPLGISELSAMLGMNKSNVHDIVSTFVDMNYLVKDLNTNKYYLGLNAMRIGRAAGKSLTIWDVVSARIREISNTVNETVYFVVPMDRNVFYVDIALPGTLRVPSISQLYDTDEMHSTACGKAILAYMPESFIDAYIAKGLTRYTEYTITDPDLLRTELAITRKRGYARAFMDRTLGICSVGVPIMDRRGEIYGAISISGSSVTVTEEKVPEYARLLKSNADYIAASAF